MGISYTKEQEEFLMKNYYGISRKELTEKFNNQFNTDKSIHTIKSWCNNRKLNCGLDRKFKKEDVPWNKGKKGDDYFAHYDIEKVKEHCKRLHENNRTAVIGEERIISGVPHIRVVAGRRTERNERWVRKRYIIWEQSYGQIPNGHCIVSLDGNRMNCDISNLACIPKKYMTLLSKNKWFSENKAITESAIKWCELHNVINEQ